MSFPDFTAPKPSDDLDDLLSKLVRLLYDANLKGADGIHVLDPSNPLPAGVVLDCIVPDPSVTFSTLTVANRTGAALTGVELTQPIFGTITAAAVSSGFAIGYKKRA